LSVADGVIILVDSVAGLEVGTEIAFQYAAEFKLPQLLVINKMERENANFKKALASVQEHVDTRLVPMQLPWGEKSDFQGVIDLVTMKAYKGDGKVVAEIPAEFKEEAESYRVALVEAAAEGEDALLEKYFENGDLSNDPS
jgi:elongation factor G